jgi:hypothetical protein
MRYQRQLGFHIIYPLPRDCESALGPDADRPLNAALQEKLLSLIPVAGEDAVALEDLHEKICFYGS